MCCEESAIFFANITTHCSFMGIFFQFCIVWWLGQSIDNLILFIQFRLFDLSLFYWCWQSVIPCVVTTQGAKNIDKLETPEASGQGGQLPIKILADLESKPVAPNDLLLLLAPIDFQIFLRLCNLQAYGSLWFTATIVRRATNPLTQ